MIPSQISVSRIFQIENYNQYSYQMDTHATWQGSAVSKQECNTTVAGRHTRSQQQLSAINRCESSPYSPAQQAEARAGPHSGYEPGQALLHAIATVRADRLNAGWPLAIHLAQAQLLRHL